MYFLPAMPLRARVWWIADGIPPTNPADGEVIISLSPLSPTLAFRPGLPSSQQATHIIRALRSLAWADNYEPGEPGTLFPCTVIEYPIDTQDFYCTVWAHVCGEGFSNAHVRAYVLRVPTERVVGAPLFQGRI